MRCISYALYIIIDIARLTVTSNQDDNKLIAGTIFNRLQMFQYYQYLREYDKKLRSLFIPPNADIDPNLNVKFLKEWDYRDHQERQNIKGWEFSGETISKDNFVKQFLSHSIHINYEVIEVNGNP